jgi:diguanylate cyclase (GGDEF)-like protein
VRHLIPTRPKSSRQAAAVADSFTKDLATCRRELRFFLETARSLTSSRQPKTVLRTIINKARAMIRCQAWSLFLVDPDTQDLVFEMVGGPKARRLKGLHIRSGHGIVGWVAAHGKPVIVTDVRRDRRFMRDVDQATGFTTKSALCVPILNKNKPVAILQMLNKIGSAFDQDDLRLLTRLIDQASIALERALLIEQVSNLAITDELTGLFNAHYLDETLERELRRCRRYDSPLALIFLDLDRFKEINALHGHPAGSACLVELTAIMRKSVRDVDILVRYGGDEFVVILPETSVRTAYKVSERLRRSIRRHVFCGNSRLKVQMTASIGLAGYPDHAKTKQDLIKKADESMYRAKAAGGNRIYLASEP